MGNVRHFPNLKGVVIELITQLLFLWVNHLRNASAEVYSFQGYSQVYFAAVHPYPFECRCISLLLRASRRRPQSVPLYRGQFLQGVVDADRDLVVLAEPEQRAGHRVVEAPQRGGLRTAWKRAFERSGTQMAGHLRRFGRTQPPNAMLPIASAPARKKLLRFTMCPRKG